MRQQNLAIVLRHLHEIGTVSRAQLTEISGLNRSTVGDLIHELSGLGLVEDTGQSVARIGPGRPSRVLGPRLLGATVIAVDFGLVDSFRVAAVGLGGDVAGQVETVLDHAQVTPQRMATEIAEACRRLLPSVSLGRLVGVGVAAVGLIRRTDGMVHLAPNLGWRQVGFGELLSEALRDVSPVLNVPVRLANEADLGAIAEHVRGAGRGVDEMIYISGQAGIGVGVITGGVPLVGAAGYAGEAGHMLVNPRGSRCGCGAVGCWETEAGLTALSRRAGLPVDISGLEAVDLLVRRSADNDENALRALSEVGWWLGLGAADLANIFNPSLIALGGLYHKLYDWIEHEFQAGFDARVLAPTKETVRITRSSLGHGGPLAGAAEMAFEDLLHNPTVCCKAIDSPAE